MPLPHLTPTDPLAAFMAGAFTGPDRHPLPLQETRFDVTLRAGLAMVETRRVFRNAEAISIETTITFPVPVHATLFRLEARIDGRLLTARAARRASARATYEEALERGRTGVLHEEVLRGIHMLSVGQIPPGAEIAVTATWAATLAMVGAEGRLRIPLTVGDVYGRSGLPDSDDLRHGGIDRPATLAVRCDDGTVTLRGGRLDGSVAIVPLNAPIDLVVTGWQPAVLGGRAADGRNATLAIAPLEASEAALDVAILADHSGSMASAADSAGPTKHQALVAGLVAAAANLQEGDAIDLWEFDGSAARVGSTADEARWFDLRRRDPGGRLAALAGQLSPPAGGTEIGRAIAAVLAGPARRDILLVTDGKSHALDIQALARAGRRIAVLLVGADSLEANVGHLAALTGGEILVAAGADIAPVLATLLAGLRRPAGPQPPIAGALRTATTIRGNARLTARWDDAAAPVADNAFGRAVAAVAAAIALPTLDAEAAAALAEAEGLVTHLTSLVLVDEAGEVQEGVPAQRPIALPSPSVTLGSTMPGLGSGVTRRASQAPLLLRRLADSPAGTPRDCAAQMAPEQEFSAAFANVDPAPLGDGLAEGSRPFPRLRRAPAQAAPALDRLRHLAAAIDWDRAPNDLVGGLPEALPRDVAAFVEVAARTGTVPALAAAWGLDPARLVVAILAWLAGSANRTAARVAAALLGAPPDAARLEPVAIAILRAVADEEGAPQAAVGRG